MLYVTDFGRNGRVILGLFNSAATESCSLYLDLLVLSLCLSIPSLSCVDLLCKLSLLTFVLIDV